MNIQTGVELGNFNSMATPAIASHLVRANSIDDIRSAIEFANLNNLSCLVLGEGSNTLFSTNYEGLVLLNRIKGIELIEQTDSSVTLKVGAGENWHEFVEYTVNQGWSGLENLALIPGLVGASPIQNIGAYGVEVKDYLVSVEFFDFQQKECRYFSNSECQFGYRDSVFKHSLRDKGAVTAVTFKLSTGDSLSVDDAFSAGNPSTKLSYPALASYLQNKPDPSAKDIFEAVCAIRTEKLPSPKDIPNSGSFFKNPVISEKQHQSIKQSYPNLVSYPIGNKFKLAAGWLIENAGWKGKSINNVSVHDKQALVVVNPNKESGESILAFAKEIQVDIDRRYGVKLEIEPQIV